MLDPMNARRPGVCLATDERSTPGAKFFPFAWTFKISKRPWTSGGSTWQVEMLLLCRSLQQILAANPSISKTGFIQSNYFRSSEPTSSDSIAGGLSEEYPVSGHEFEQDVPPGSDDRSDLTESSHVFFVVGRTKRAKEPT